MIGGQVPKTKEANTKTHGADDISSKYKVHDEEKNNSWLQRIVAKVDQFISDADEWCTKWGPYAFTGLGFGIATTGLIRDLFRPKTIQQGFMQPAEATAGSSASSLDMNAVRDKIRERPGSYVDIMKAVMNMFPPEAIESMRNGISDSRIPDLTVDAPKAPTPPKEDSIELPRDPFEQKVEALIEGALNGEGDISAPQRSLPELDWFTDEPVDMKALKEMARQSREKDKASEYRRMVLIEIANGGFKAVPLNEIRFWQFIYSETFENLDRGMQSQIMTDKDMVIEVLEDAIADSDFRKNFMNGDRITEIGYEIILGDDRIAPPTKKMLRSPSPHSEPYKPRPCIILTPKESAAMREEAQKLSLETALSSGVEAKALRDEASPEVATRNAAMDAARNMDKDHDRYGVSSPKKTMETLEAKARDRSGKNK